MEEERARGQLFTMMAESRESGREKQESIQKMVLPMSTSQ